MSKVWLQVIGEVKGIEAKELAAGMAIMWNCGITSEVVSVEPSKSGKTMTVELLCEDGAVRSRRLGASRLVALA